MVSAQNWRVSGEVIKVVHDDSNEQVEHEEGAKKYEGYKVSVSKRWSASFDLGPLNGFGHGQV